MKAIKLTSVKAQELINGTKSVIRLGGFTTGLRTNLNKAVDYCRCDFAERGRGYDRELSNPEYIYNKKISDN